MSDFQHVARATASLLLLASAWLACGDLDSLDEGRCGNLVVEPGEDCDTFATLPGAESCVSLGLPGQCRYSCAEKENGSGRIACPDGWGCGSDGICRRHSGGFGTRLNTGQGVGRWFDVADFDGDGHQDVAWVSDATLAVDFLERGVFRQGFRAPFEAVGLPSIADADGDGRFDILSPSLRGLALFRGTSTRALAPTAFTSLAVDLSRDFAFVDIDLVPEVVQVGRNVFERFPGDEPITFALGRAFPVVDDAFPAVLIAPEDQQNPFPINVGELQGRPVVGSFDETADRHGAYTESPEQIAFAYENRIDLVRPSYFVLRPLRQPVVGFFIEAPTEATLETWPPVPASHPSHVELSREGVRVNRIMLAHANRAGSVPGRSRLPCGGSYAVADEHWDLVVDGDVDGTPRVLVAFGLGDGTFHSDPCELEDVEGGSVTADNAYETPSTMMGCTERALAVDDIDGDGALDVVTATNTHVSGLVPPGSEADIDLCSPILAHPHLDDTVFEEAVAADFDGDGVSDVLASSLEPGLTFIGADGPSLRRASVVTTAPASSMRTADFDADGVHDLAFAERKGTESAVSVLFGEPGAIPRDLREVATVPELLAIEVAHFPLREGSDAAEDLLIATPEPDTETEFRFAVLPGSTDRLLQSPFVYSTRDNPTMGQNPSYLPYGAAIAPFDVTCDNEVGGDDNPQVLFMTGRLPPEVSPTLAFPASLMGSACIDSAARFAVAEDASSDLGLASGDAVRGTAVIPFVLDGVVEPAVAVFSPVPGSRRIELSLPSSSVEPSGLAWDRGAVATIEGATVAGSAASITSSPTSPIRRWSPFINNVPATCRLQPGTNPAVVFLAVHDDGECPDQGVGDAPARTVLHVILGDAVRGVAVGDLSQAQRIVSDDESTIVGYSCLNADDDAEEELLVITLVGSIPQCDSEPTLPAFSAEIRMVDIESDGRAVLRAEPIARLEASDFTQTEDLPPVSGLASGDFDGDGVDDLFVATPDNGIVWLGKAVTP